jgi:hypothetical protein
MSTREGMDGRRSGRHARIEKDIRRAAGIVGAFCLLAGASLPAAGVTITPGPGVVLSAAGPASSAAAQGICSIGQSAVGISSGGSWSSGAGILSSVSGLLAVDLTPTTDPLAGGEGDVPIDIEIGSLDQPQSVRLYYRPGGRTEYESLVMSSAGGGHWTAEIPADRIGLRGVEYYVEVLLANRKAFSPTRNRAERPWRIPVRVTDFDGDGALRTAARTFRMVSVPAILDDESAGSVLYDDLGQPDSLSWRCGRWDPATLAYSEAGVDSLMAFRPARAFWLITDQAKTIDFTGQTVFANRLDGFGLRLQPGWNQIGNPFAYGVRVTESLVDDGIRVRTFAQAVADGLIEAAPLHRYDGIRYVNEETVLSPYSGYFAANLGSRAIDLVLPSREALPSATKISSSAVSAGGFEWALKATARQEGAAEAVIDLASSAAAQPGWDRWDRLVAPLAPTQRVALCVINDSLPSGLGRLQRDVRPIGEPGGSWTIELAAATTGPVSLDWMLPSELPAGYTARLIDLELERYVDCQPNGSYAAVFYKPGTKRFQIAVGTPEWLNEQAGSIASLGGHFAAAIVGGNPSSHGSRVRLVLERPERVGLKVYDIGGRLVHAIDRVDLQSGVHVIPWDGTGLHGDRTPAGIYFIRVTGANKAVTLRSVQIR